ncbi:MAG TPA: folate family ECF transporter S component [Haploplasma sp.]|nr:folate family ECF transporter S component [Haploplasma sp.]
MELKKVVWAAVLAALSIVIDVVFKLIIPSNDMQTPYYAIPIIVSAIFLGPKYSIVIAFLGDLVSILLVGGVPLPLFSLSSTMWGVIPGLFLYKNKKFTKLLLVVLLTHIVVTATNTYAIYIHFANKNFATILVSLPLRIGMVIPNTLIISLLVEGALEPIRLRKTQY